MVSFVIQYEDQEIINRQNLLSCNIKLVKSNIDLLRR